MGLKGKLLGRLKRRSQKPSEQSINAATIAANHVPTTPTNEKYRAVDSSPIRLPVFGLDPDGTEADHFEIPSTPHSTKSGTGGAQEVSPDHTDSTHSCSVKSGAPYWDANGSGRDAVVPSMVVDVNPEERSRPLQQTEENIVFAEIADRAYKLVQKERKEKKEGRETLLEISDEKSVKLIKVAEISASSEKEDDQNENILPEVVQLSEMINPPVIEMPCGPIDIDDGVASAAMPAKSKKSSSKRSKDVVVRSSSPSKENVNSAEAKATQFERVRNEGAVVSVTGQKKRNLDGKGGSESKKEAGPVDEEKARTSSPVNPSTYEQNIVMSQEEGNTQSNASLINEIEEQILMKSPSDDESKRSRKVSFDESNHVSHQQDDVEEEDEISYYSGEEYNDDSHYYDDYEGEEYDDDHIDEATHMSGDSTVLDHDDGGIWAWLCGYDDYNTSPNSIEERYEEKSVGTIVSDDGRESVISIDYSVDVDEAATLDEGEEMSYNEEIAKAFHAHNRNVVRKSSGRRAQKIRAMTTSAKIPGLLKKKEMKQELSMIDQPRDSQGFPMKENKSTKSWTSRGNKVGKKESNSYDDVSAASASSKHVRRQGSSKDTRQLEIYCKRHGSVENLVLRKYPSVPLPAGRDHILVKVENLAKYKASTVSSRDCLLRLQGDPKEQPSPSVPGFQIVGTIFALGSSLKSKDLLHRGDRVAALTNGGGNARYVSIPASDAILLPSTATHDSLICLVSNYMTAYQSLKLAKMKKGGAPLTNCNVLITGGSGPVGQALIDLASREGARVITTAHQMHEEHLTKNLGAKWFPVNPRKWLPTLEGQMDVVVDSLCVDGYESSYKALAPDGVLICTGNTSGNSNKHPTESMLESKHLKLWWSDLKAKHVWKNCFFYNIYESYQSDPKLFQQELLYLYLQLENGNINPKVAGRVALNQVPKAQRLIEKGLPNGTVILYPWKRLDPRQAVSIEKCGYESR